MTSSTKPFLEVVNEGEKRKVNDAVTEPHRLPHGLYNQGATCYLNSVLQVLFMTPEIHDRLDPKSQITDEELRNLFKKLKKATCGTEKITKILSIENVHGQRDAAGCLELILHKVSPQASEVFEGQLTHTTECSKCHSINKETNPFWTLPLSLKDTHNSAYSVEKGFEGIFKPISFSGDNMVYCNECKKKKAATTGCEMVKYPQILTLLLKRSDNDNNTMSYVKSHRCVDVPCELQTRSGENNKYRLYGMVNHMGGLRGHYTATILSHEDNIWYEFNDDRVSKVEEQPFAQNRTYKSSTAYLLMYRASTLRDKVKQRQDVGEQRGYKGKYKRNYREREADYEENRPLKQNQQSQRPMRREMKKGSPRPQVQDESFKRDIREEGDPLYHIQNTRYPSKQHSEDRISEKRKQRSKNEKGVNCPQPCRSSTDINRKPLLIFSIVFVCALIVIILVIIPTTLEIA